MIYDAVIIGAGVSGCAVARELSRYELTVAVLEKESDICEGTSKANSGIVHAGFDNEPGSLMAEMNVRGNAMMEKLSKELDFPFRRNTSMVLCFREEDLPKLEILKERGEKNGVPGICILSGEEARKHEPALSEKVVGALLAPTGGIVCPFGLTIALAENANVNGVEFYRNTEVQSIEKDVEGYVLKTSGREFHTRLVINAVGVYADRFHNMVSAEKVTIIPRKGEYCLLDKSAGTTVGATIFQLPTEYGKGVLVTPTVHGNLLTGPTAEDIEDKEATCTTAEGLADVQKRAGLSVPDLPWRQIITSFAGLRAHLPEHDFRIEEVKDAPGFIDVMGIESPGLTSAPAIGERVAEIVKTLLHDVKNKEHFVAERKGIPSVAMATNEERQALIRQNPAYANVVCRCELVTEGEILDAIRRPVGAVTLDGIKRRTRAGMGRCQAGFCSPKTVEILAKELQKDVSEVTKCGSESEFLVAASEENCQLQFQQTSKSKEEF